MKIPVSYASWKSTMKNDCPPLNAASNKPDRHISPKGLPKGVGLELFRSIKDPLLVVTPQGKIVQVNSALLKATNKKADEVIGKGICQIIHGGRWPHIKCPLEEFLLTNGYKVEDTRLPGLNGEYSLTIVPGGKRPKRSGSDTVDRQKTHPGRGKKGRVYSYRPTGSHRGTGCRCGS